jgi:WD40 repeat protein
MRWPDVAISPDGTWLACYDDNGPIRVWELATGTERFSLTEHTELVIFAISPDSTWFATGGNSVTDETGVQIWDSFTGELRDALPGHSGRLGALEISRDGAWLATADGVNLVRDEVNKLVRIWAVPPDGNWAPLARQNVLNPVIDVSPDGTCVAIGASGALQVAELITGMQRLTIQRMPAIRSVRFDPRGEWLAISTVDGIEIRSCATGELQRLLRHDEPGVNLLEVAPDGTWLVTSATPVSLEDLNQQSAYSAYIWDMATGEPRHILRGHDCGVGATAIAPNGAYLITCDGNRVRDRDTVARIWSTSDGRLRLKLAGHRDGVGALAISSDSAWLVTGEALMDEQKTCKARIWDAVTGSVLHNLGGHVGMVTAATIASDDAWLSTGDVAGTVRIWDAANGQLKYSMPGSAPVGDIAVSPDGRWLAVCDGAGGMGTLRIWDPLTGAAVAAMRVDGPLYECRWHSDLPVICLRGARGVYVFDWHPGTPD